MLKTRLTVLHCIFNWILLCCVVYVAFDYVFNKRILYTTTVSCVVYMYVFILNFWVTKVKSSQVNSFP